MPNAIKPTLNHALRIWWAWYWRATLWAFGASFLVGFAQGLLGIRGPYAEFIGAVVGLVASVYILKIILRKTFEGFRVEVVSNDNLTELSPSEVPIACAFRFWLAWVWRWSVASIALLIVVVLAISVVGVFVELTPATRFWLGFIFGALVSIGISLHVIKTLVHDKDFGAFKVRLYSTS